MTNPSKNSVIRVEPMSIEALAAQFLDKIFRRKKEETRPDRQVEEQITPPWESWELDKSFFKALSQWTLIHPETTLDRVLDRISNGLENNKDLFQLIPDTPFPARGLMTALAHLFKLGVKVSRAKKDVQEFAKDVIRWVGSVRSTFDSPEDGRFTRQTWQNLKDTRDLVDEVCLWAVKRLNDGRWSQIRNGLMIQNEIQEFRERIASARALFQDRSSIIQAKGIDIIIQSLAYLFDRQEVVASEIQKIREIQEKHFKQLMSKIETQMQVDERNRFFAETLDTHTVANPTYDAQGKRPCDEDTRIEVLDTIRKWTNDISPKAPNFLWLTGDPGCGKSAITASLARECKDRGVLWAQFFINRNNAETTDPRSYFPSIARQLATHSTDVAETIHHILQKQLSLLDDISADQASKLFADSIGVASQADPDRPVVTIIDGLDETSHDRLEDTAKIFSTLFTALKAYKNVKVFISSRTENEIQSSFILPAYEKHVKRVHLDTAEPSSVQDVSRYIKRNLGDLVKKHDLNWAVWPGDERSQILGQRASGLFIWGVTAIKFIQEQLSSNGEECLDNVLDMLTADVLKDINALYMLILRVTHGDQEDEWGLERFRRIVGAIVFLQEPLCIDDLASLLDLRRTPFSRPADIAHFVRRFRTLLVTGTDSIDGNTIPRIHKSVFEFVTSNSIDANFRVNPSHVHLEIAVQCLMRLVTARELITEDALPMPFRYASRFWSSHLLQVNMRGPATLCADCSRSPSTTSSFFSSISTAPPVSKPTQIRCSLTSSEITIAVKWPVTWDLFSGVPRSHKRWYHKGRVTGIALSPDCENIVSCSHDKTIKINNMTYMRSYREVRPLVAHSSQFNAIALSPNGRSIVTGSKDGLIHIWDYSTRTPIGQPLRGHKDGVLCVAFSPDGGRIVSGSRDKTCILWDTRNGQAIGVPWTGHTDPSCHVAFSGSSRRVCSVDFKGHCIVWDANTGQKIREWKFDQYPTCLSFSPTDDEIIAMGGTLDRIQIRSNNMKWTIPDSEDTHCLSFLPDGREIIFSALSTIYVVEIDKDESTARLVRKRNFLRAGRISSAAFSPNLDYFVYADDANAIYLFSLHHTQTSLKVVPINTWANTKLFPNIDGASELKRALSNMKKTYHIHDTLQATNRRLREITWYQLDSVGNAMESTLQACVVTGDVLIAGYRDGSVSVWDQRDMDEDEK